MCTTLSFVFTKVCYWYHRLGTAKANIESFKPKQSDLKFTIGKTSNDMVNKKIKKKLCKLESNVKTACAAHMQVPKALANDYAGEHNS